VAQVVAARVLITELGDDLVPMGRVAQYRRGDPAAARASENACRRVMADRFDASFDERSDFFDERDGASPLALSAFVDEKCLCR
jgi:hypothetical protein